MRSISIALPEDAAAKLQVLARRELRRPRDQATVLILEGIRRAGLDAPLQPDERAAVETPSAR